MGKGGSGKTYTGMVKSYNRKGFGFIMCQGLDQDIYFSRESVHPQLQTSDLAGEHVTFEVHRFPDGKLQARSLRAVGDVSGFKGPREGPPRPPRPQMSGKPPAGTPFYAGKEEEDQSRDWFCENCGARNFMKRFECFKCKAPRPAGGIPDIPVVQQPPPRRTLSPHAGSRAMRDVFAARLAAKQGRSRSRSRSRKRSRSKRKRKRSSSGSSSSREKKKKRSKKKASSSSASSSEVEDVGKSASAGASAKKDEEAPSNPEVEKAKSEVLEKLMKLREVEPKEERIKRWRALLREWHPDKNLDRAEVATAVFQFLQKGKRLIDPE